MKEFYGIDMEINQYSKTIDMIPKADIIITMGCDVHCPIFPDKQFEDWGLNDPTGKEDTDFLLTIEIIRKKIIALL